MPDNRVHVNIIDHAGVVQDLTFAFTNYQTSPGDTGDYSLSRPTWSRSSENYITLHFYVREYLLLPDMEVLGYHIGEKMEVWAGGVDDDGHWIDDENLFGGYIRIFDVAQDAGMVNVRLTLDTYNVLLKTPVQSFPDPLVLTRTYHSPPAPSDVKIEGAAIGYTPKDWLSGLSYLHGGTKAFDGIWRQAFPGNGADGAPVDLSDDGIPDIPWALVTFDSSGRVSNTSVLGHSEITTVEELTQGVLDLAAMLLLARNDGKGSMGGFYLAPIIDPADPTKLKPKLIVKDINDKSTVLKTFTDFSAAGEGEIGTWGDYSARVDGTDAADWVTVIGAGSQFAGFDPTTHQRLYTRIVSSNTDSRGTYHNRYSNTPGHELQIYSDTITTIAQANQLADYIAANVVGGRRSCSFTSYVPVQEGEVIRIKHQASQGVGTAGQVYIVTSARRHGILPRWDVQAGDPRPTLQGIMNGPLMRLFGLGLVLNPRGRGLPNFTNPALPKGRTVQTVTSNRFHNGLQSADTAVPVLKQMPATGLTKMTANGQPIGTNRVEVVDEEGNTVEIINYVDTQQYTTLQRPVLCNDPTDTEHPKYATVLPAPQRFTLRPDGVTMDDWDMGNGQNGPELHVYSFSEDSWRPVVYAGTVYICRAEILRVLDANTGAVLAPIYGSGTGSAPTVTIAGLAPGLTATLKQADPVTGAMTPVDPAVDGAHPLRLQQPHDAAQIHISGITGNWEVEVIVSEEGLLYDFFLPCEERYCPDHGCSPPPPPGP